MLNADKGTCDPERNRWGDHAERKHKLHLQPTETSLDSPASCDLCVQGGVNGSLSPIFRHVNFKAVRVDPHFQSQLGSCTRQPVSKPLTWCCFHRLCVVNPSSKPARTSVQPKAFPYRESTWLHLSLQQWDDGKQTENRSMLMGDVADSENAEKLRPGKGN